MSNNSAPKKKIAFLVTHPIQYLSPLFRYLTDIGSDRIEVIVYYQSNCSIAGYIDKSMGCLVKWGVDLLDGYKYKFIPCIGKNKRLTYIKPFSYGLEMLLESYAPDALIILGYNRPFHWLAMSSAHRLGIDVYLRDDMNLNWKKRSTFNVMAKRIFFNIIDKYVTGYLTVGKLNYDYYRYHGIVKQKLYNFPWAVNNEFFQTEGESDSNKVSKLRQDLGIRDTSPVILYVGKLLRNKGVLELLDAFDLLSENVSSSPYLILVGNGELLTEAQARSHKNQSIIPVGFKSQIELTPYYALCDLFVLPSHRETWGLVVNEAMAAGKPVIVSNKVGCWPDLIEEGQTGRVFVAGDVQSLLSVLIGCLKDKEKLMAMGKAALSKIDGFSFKNNLEQITYILKQQKAMK